MKKLIFLTYILLYACLLGAQETMYMMKGGEVIKQLNVATEVDSLIFYPPPPPAPVAVSSINLMPNAVTMFVGETLDLSAYLSIGPANATDKTVTWSPSNNPTVLVNATTGIATAGSIAGSATITATTNDGSNLSATINITVSEETPNPYYKGTIPNAVYIGRWTKKNIPQNFVDTYYDHSFHNGSKFKVNFTGTKAILTVAPSSNFAWRVDGGSWQTYSPSGFSPVDVSLAQGLSNTEHSLEVKGFSTSGMVNGNAFLKCSTLTLDAGAETRAPNINNKHIEFIGDSISTLGYEDTDAGQHWNWLIGESTGWEHTHIAYPGINIDQMTVVYDKLFASQNATLWYPTNPLWDFSLYTPDAVVINLGQNSGADQSQYEAIFNLVREKYPDAKIFGVGLFYFRSGGNRSPFAVECENAVNALRNAGDGNIYFLGEAENTASTHPTPAQSITISGLLLPAIQAKLGL